MVPLGLFLSVGSYAFKKIMESDAAQELINSAKEKIDDVINEGVKSAIDAFNSPASGNFNFAGALMGNINSSDTAASGVNYDRKFAAALNDPHNSRGGNPDVLNFGNPFNPSDKFKKSVLFRGPDTHEFVSIEDGELKVAGNYSTISEVESWQNNLNKYFNENEKAALIDKYKDVLVADEDEVKKNELATQGPTQDLWHHRCNWPHVEKSYFEEYKNELRKYYNENEIEIILDSILFNEDTQLPGWIVVDDKEFYMKYRG